MVKIPTGLSSIAGKKQDGFTGKKEIRAVRVKFVLLNSNQYPTTWKDKGEYMAIGGIFFEELDNPGDNSLETLSLALPLYSNIKFLPLVNEIVYIINLPNPSSQRNISGGQQDYYFQTINIWNSIHHNALPNSLANEPTNAQKYNSTEAGIEIQSDVEVGDINLGLTLIEGRWGNTLRFGSTVNNSHPPNPWSDSGINGEPIIIIKNGQTETKDDSWVTQVENINSDKSSIYLTSNQQIPIEGASTNYKSYDTPPESPNEFIGEQVLINSGRLYFNAKRDSILLSAEKSINLNTNNSVNIDSKNKFVVDTREVYLGSKDATEPVILGDKFLSDFQKLLTDVISLTTALGTVGTPIPFTPNIAVAQTATKVGLQAQTMLTSITFYKSKTTKTL